MKLNKQCHDCNGREYHCQSYVDLIAIGFMHFGETCPFYREQNEERLVRNLHHRLRKLESVEVGE